MEELKPCPFCGGKAVLTDQEFEIVDENGIRVEKNYGVRCLHCYAQSYQFCETKEIASSLWNERADK
jgi:hypothetical protein